MLQNVSVPYILFSFKGLLYDEGLKVLVQLGLQSNDTLISETVIGDEKKTESSTPLPSGKYKNADITNKDDNKIRSKLDEADAALEKVRFDIIISFSRGNEFCLSTI